MDAEQVHEAALEMVRDHLTEGPEYQAFYEWAEEDGWAERDTQSVITTTREILNELLGSLT